MTEDQYFVLCEKYLKGDCTPQEKLLIKNYQDTTGLSNHDITGLDNGDKRRIKKLLYNRLQNSLKHSKTPPVKLFRWQYTAAASLLAILSIGIYIAMLTRPKQQPVVAHINKIIKNDIEPGTNKAVLTLANGKTITLDDAKNGIVSKQGNSAISKSGNGIVIKNNTTVASSAIALNTISIPRGGKYTITLPDGTRVWLNSSSSLTFPTAFVGTERKVTVSGEAYFEVTKNKAMPFKVDVNGKQVVEVLGTYFNINAYTDEDAITTTLLEGSVKINYNNKATLIKPGQMAVNNLGANVIVKTANIDEIMAWKNDMFIFNNENITTMMKRISRWYDVDVVFKGDMENINFDGNYSRSKGLASLLKNIELVNKVRFVNEERRITVIAK